MHTEFWWINLEKNGHLGDQGDHVDLREGGFEVGECGLGSCAVADFIITSLITIVIIGITGNIYPSLFRFILMPYTLHVHFCIK